MKRKLIVWSCVCLMTLTAARADEPQPRVAVVSDAANKDLAALITTELSSNPSVTLIERDDLAKIGDEAKVLEMAGNDAAALGKLANADGLFFLDQRADGTHVRFTAVNLGYALFDDPVPAYINPQQEAKALAHLVADAAPKLKLDPKKAIPLSVLNLRSDYGTAASLKLERDLTLLLESRLATVPEYVVLERRHAWALDFEHTLAPEADPILRSACLIDGSISLASRGNDKVEVSLRIRKPGRPTSTAILRGNADNLSDVADRLLQAVHNAVGGTSPASQASSSDEAREYLREALWGWRSREPQAALEAADSAELLGGNEADILALRAQSLVSVAEQGMESWYPYFGDDDKPPPFTAVELDGRTDAILRALSDAVRYRDEKLQDKIDVLKQAGPWEQHNFGAGSIGDSVGNAASKLLVLLDRAQAPRADELRQKLRVITDYDPLKGKPGRKMPGSYNNTITRYLFADDWAQSIAEETAFYQLVCVDREQVLPTRAIDEPGKIFCARFLPTPEAREKAFADFVESLKSRPECRRTYLALKTHDADPAIADKAYRDYLGVLEETRDQLIHSNDYSPALESTYDIAPEVTARNASAGLPLLHALLTDNAPGSCSGLLFHLLWRPANFQKQDVPQLWAEVNAYRQRHTAAVWARNRTSDPSFDMDMDNLVAPLVQKYPDICVSAPTPPATIPDALSVTKFWHPWLLPGTPDDFYCIQDTDVSTDGLWLGGNYGSKGAIYHINLTTFESEKITLPNEAYPAGIKSIGGYLYAEYRPDEKSPKRAIGRYDLKTGTWQTREIPDLSWFRMYEACGQLYLFVTVQQPFKETALVRYDFDAGNWIELANNRRRPARNQFDDCEPLIDIGGIYTGPGNRPCITAPGGTFYIQETLGPWPSAFDDADWSKTVTESGRTLVLNYNGETTLMDAAAVQPEHWTANPLPHIRHMRRKGVPDPAVPTPWASQARWQTPEHEKERWPTQVAFHGNNLYALDISPNGGNCELLCYVSGEAQPRHIPLSFSLSDQTKAALSSPHIRLYSWTRDKLGQPQLQFTHYDAMMSYHVVGTNQGMCLVYMTNGFWFLPYRDIEAYLHSHPQPVTAATKAAPDKTTKAGAIDDYDPGNPMSFR